MPGKRGRGSGPAVVLATVMLVATVSAGAAAPAGTPGPERGVAAGTGGGSFDSTVDDAGGGGEFRFARPVVLRGGHANGGTQPYSWSSKRAGTQSGPQLCPGGTESRGTIDGPSSADLGQEVTFSMSPGETPRRLSAGSYDVKISTLGASHTFIDTSKTTPFLLPGDVANSGSLYNWDDDAWLKTNEWLPSMPPEGLPPYHVETPSAVNVTFTTPGKYRIVGSQYVQAIATNWPRKGDVTRCYYVSTTDVHNIEIGECDKKLDELQAAWNKLQGLSVKIDTEKAALEASKTKARIGEYGAAGSGGFVVGWVAVAGASGPGGIVIGVFAGASATGAYIYGTNSAAAEQHRHALNRYLKAFDTWLDRYLDAWRYVDLCKGYEIPEEYSTAPQPETFEAEGQ